LPIVRLAVGVLLHDMASPWSPMASSEEEEHAAEGCWAATGWRRAAAGWWQSGRKLERSKHTTAWKETRKISGWFIYK